MVMRAVSVLIARREIIIDVKMLTKNKKLRVRVEDSNELETDGSTSDQC